MHSNQLAAEVCSGEEEFNMCPLCDIDVGCNFWNLSEVCSYAQLAYLFDHPGTVFYAVFMSFWGECQPSCSTDASQPRPILRARKLYVMADCFIICYLTIHILK